MEGGPPKVLDREMLRDYEGWRTQVEKDAPMAQVF